MLDIPAIREALAKATPYPWKANFYKVGGHVMNIQGSPGPDEKWGEVIVLKMARPTSRRAKVDAGLIANAPTWLREACDEIEAQAARIAELEAENARLRGATQVKKFPILGSRGAKICWQLVADHGRQCEKNHYQTVERLAERGGLSWSEMHAVLHNREWRKMDENQAIVECRLLEATYLAALASGDKPHA